MRLRALTATLLAFAVAGCGQAATGGGGDFSGEEQAVADVVGDLQAAGRDRDPDEICSNLLADALREQVRAADADCVEEMRKAIEDADGFELEVTDVTVTGPTARAQVRSRDRGKDVTRTFQFAKEQGDWRIKSFG